MAVEQNKRQELTNLILECIKEVFPIVINKIEEKKYISSHSSFPKLSFRENGFPNINNSWTNNGPKNYASLFHKYGREAPDIDWNNFITLENLYKYIANDHELLNYFGFGLRVSVPEIDLNRKSVELLVENILDYYIHVYGFDFNENNLLKVIELRTNFAFLEKLKITIYVPILFLNFEVDRYDLAEGISIQKLSDLVHLSRVEAKSNNVLVHDCILEGATHALVIENYYIDNKDKDSFGCLYRKEAYPNFLIINFFSALRLITDYKTGYAQIFSNPENWTTNFKEKLLNIRGCSVKEFPNEFELDHYWLNQSFSSLNQGDLEKIKKIYGKLSNNNHKSIPIALKRLNSCMLRHDEEDTVLDATIALEVLLSDDGKTEMTHKLALRIAALSKLDDGCKEIPKEIFNKVKKIYSYRSGIVHGTKDLTKSRIIRIPNSIELKTVDVAIDILKMVLRVLLCNEQYFDAKKIDEELLLGVGGDA